MTVGEKIRDLRVKNDLSQLELAEMLGYTGRAPQSNISKWETGLKPVPKKKIGDLCVIFSIKPEDLMSDTKYSNKKTEEGYSDPTAYKAMKAVYPEMKLSVGVVYLVAIDPSRDAAVLALNYDDYYIYGLSVYRQSDARVKNIGTSNMFYAEGFYVDLRQTKAFVRSKVKKEAFYFANFKTFSDIKKALCAKFGLNSTIEKTVEVPVEKVVEKIVEVPVDDTEVKLLRQRADIYQDICEKLLAKGNVS